MELFHRAVGILLALVSFIIVVAISIGGYLILVGKYIPMQEQVDNPLLTLLTILVTLCACLFGYAIGVTVNDLYLERNDIW